MRMFAFAVLFLCAGAGASAQQVSLLEDEVNGPSKAAVAADDGMQQIIAPKEDEPDLTPPPTGQVTPLPEAGAIKPAKRFINKKKKSEAVAVSSATVQEPSAPAISSGTAPAPAPKPAAVETRKQVEISTAPSSFSLAGVQPEKEPVNAVTGKTAVPVKPAEAYKPAAVAAQAAAPVKPAVKPAANSAGKAKPAVVRAAPAVAGAGFAVSKTHTVHNGDTLWGLSEKYYKDPYRWGKIYNANLDKLNSPDRIYPSAVLVIPGLSEEVKPAAAKTPAITGKNIVKEPVASRAEGSKQIEAPVPAPAVPAAAPVNTAKAELGDMLKEFDSNDLSEEMPEHQKEWSSGVDIVPDSWQEDGVISGADKGEKEQMDNSLSSRGDVMLVSMSEQVTVNRGDYLEVYLKGAGAFDKAGKKIGREIQPAGTLQVLSSDGRQAKARVINALTAIIKGYVVKKK